MNPRGPAAGAEWDVLLGFFSDVVTPFLPWFVAVVVVIMVVRLPLPGRGPGLLARKDPWRGFRYQARRTVLGRAGGRCEATHLFVRRCPLPAEEVDHIYPWSKHGATVVSNGQALCRKHNRAKLDLTPPWWYVLSLEHRRRAYFPPTAERTVRGGMTPEERAVRAAWLARKKVG